MSIRNVIGQPVVQKTVIVDRGGSQKYKFVGSPDGNILAESIMLMPDRVELYTRHWSRVLGSPFNPDLVKHVCLVHLTLQPAEWKPDDEQADAEGWVSVPPYDITEIAAFARKDGLTFVEMLGAAYNVVGLVEETNVRDISTFDQIAAGNLAQPQASS